MQQALAIQIATNNVTFTFIQTNLQLNPKHSGTGEKQTDRLSFAEPAEGL